MDNIDVILNELLNCMTKLTDKITLMNTKVTNLEENMESISSSLSFSNEFKNLQNNFDLLSGKFNYFLYNSFSPLSTKIDNTLNLNLQLKDDISGSINSLSNEILTFKHDEASMLNIIHKDLFGKISGFQSEIYKLNIEDENLSNQLISSNYDIILTNDLINDVSDNLSGKINNISSFIDFISNDLSIKIENTSENLSTKIINATELLTNEINTISGNISNNVNNISTSLTDEIITISGNISNNVNNISTSLTNEINTISGILSSEIKNTTEFLTNELSEEIDLVSGNLTSSINVTSSLINDKIDLVSGNISNKFNNKIIEISNNFNNNIYKVNNKINLTSSNLNNISGNLNNISGNLDIVNESINIVSENLSNKINEIIKLNSLLNDDDIKKIVESSISSLLTPDYILPIVSNGGFTTSESIFGIVNSAYITGIVNSEYVSSIVNSDHITGIVNSAYILSMVSEGGYATINWVKTHVDEEINELNLSTYQPYGDYITSNQLTDTLSNYTTSDSIPEIINSEYILPIVSSASYTTSDSIYGIINSEYVTSIVNSHHITGIVDPAYITGIVNSEYLNEIVPGIASNHNFVTSDVLNTSIWEFSSHVSTNYASTGYINSDLITNLGFVHSENIRSYIDYYVTSDLILPIVSNGGYATTGYIMDLNEDLKELISSLHTENEDSELE